jgi:DNA-binding transcriptional LysR family regulator
LNIKQSTLSRRIATLEHRLGIQLFERSTRGAVSTQQGKAFLAVARRILTDLDNLQTTARAVSYGEEGRFALGFCGSLMTGNLRAAIAEFMNRFPDVQFDATEAGPDKLISDLQARAVDAVVAPASTADAATAARRLWTERLMLALPESHALSEIDAIHWTDLRAEVFVLAGDGIGTSISRLLKAKLAGHGYRATIITQNTSVESILSTVTIGRYIKIATEASMGVTWPGLVFREIADQGGPTRIDYSLYWRDDNDNPALKRFFKLLDERYPA